MQKNKKTTLVICLSFLVLCLLVLSWWEIYIPKNPGKGSEVVFSVQKGEGSKDIAINLKNAGLIKSATVFRLYVLTAGEAGNLQAGDYLISSGMNIPQISGKMERGEVVKKTITIIEGWNLRDIGWSFEDKGFFQAEELFRLVGFPSADYSEIDEMSEPKDFSQEFGFLEDKPKNLSLEGYLFPDTYEIRKDESLEDVARKILKNFDKKLASDLREEIFSQNKTIFEILTMASLLEKEVRTYEDKKTVSGILWKRLKNRVPLQVDATISYITGKKDVKVLISETKIDSPYNTYKYRGLPLGPICNPGLESIKAAVYPVSSGFWYYLSTPEGETIFSKTLEGHNYAKAKYLK